MMAFLDLKRSATIVGQSASNANKPSTILKQ